MFNGMASPSLADIAAVTGNGRNGDGWGDGNGWWVLIILFAIFGGWGRGNNGWDNNGGGSGSAAYTDAAIQRGFDTQTVVSKLDGIANGLCDGFYAQNTAIMNGFHGVDNAICNLGYQTQQGFNNTNVALMQGQNAIQQTLNNMAAQNSACCCETQRQLERGFADTNYNLATQSCETRQAIADSTRSILDFITADKISTLQAENQNLKFQASQTAQNAYIAANQEAQTAELIRHINPMPVPAFTVPAPYAYAGCNNGCC